MYLFSAAKPSLDEVFQAKHLKVRGKSEVQKLIGNPISRVVPGSRDQAGLKSAN
jgi:hypothetical protein